MIVADDTWRAFSGLHGGLVVAWLLEQAMHGAGNGRVPAAVTGHFLGSVEPDDRVAWDRDDVHVGRTTASVAVRLRQAGRIRAHAMVEVAEADAGDGHWDPRLDTASLPKPENVAQFVLPAEFVPFSVHLDIRPLTARVPGGSSDRPEYEAWIRMTDPAEATALGPLGTVAVLLDAMPPGLLALWSTPRAIPTVEFTAHFAAPADDPAGWFHVRHRTTWAGVRRCIDDTDVHDPAGRLIAQARQTRRIL